MGSGKREAGSAASHRSVPSHDVDGFAEYPKSASAVKRFLQDVCDSLSAAARARRQRRGYTLREDRRVLRTRPTALSILNSSAVPRSFRSLRPSVPPSLHLPACPPRLCASAFQFPTTHADRRARSIPGGPAPRPRSSPAPDAGSLTSCIPNRRRPGARQHLFSDETNPFPNSVSHVTQRTYESSRPRRPAKTNPNEPDPPANSLPRVPSVFIRGGRVQRGRTLWSASPTAALWLAAKSFASRQAKAASRPPHSITLRVKPKRRQGRRTPYYPPLPPLAAQRGRFRRAVASPRSSPPVVPGDARWT